MKTAVTSFKHLFLRTGLTKELKSNAFISQRDFSVTVLLNLGYSLQFITEDVD